MIADAKAHSTSQPGSDSHLLARSDAHRDASRSDSPNSSSPPSGLRGKRKLAASPENGRRGVRAVRKITGRPSRNVVAQALWRSADATAKGKVNTREAAARAEAKAKAQAEASAEVQARAQAKPKANATAKARAEAENEAKSEMPAVAPARLPATLAQTRDRVRRRLRPRLPHLTLTLSLALRLPWALTALPDLCNLRDLRVHHAPRPRPLRPARLRPLPRDYFAVTRPFVTLLVGPGPMSSTLTCRLRPWARVSSVSFRS